MTRGRRTTGTAGSIARWLGRLPPDGERLELRTYGLSERQVVSTWSYESRDASRDLAAEVLSAADDDARSREHATAYQLVAVVDGRDVATMAFRRAYSGDAIVEGTGPDALVAQSLRHTEAMTRACLQTMQAAVAQMAQHSATALARVERLEVDREELLEQVRALSSSSVDLEAERGRQERFERLLDIVEPMLPVAAQKLLGGGQ